MTEARVLIDRARASQSALRLHKREARRHRRAARDAGAALAEIRDECARRGIEFDLQD